MHSDDVRFTRTHQNRAVRLGDIRLPRKRLTSSVVRFIYIAFDIYCEISGEKVLSHCSFFVDRCHCLICWTNVEYVLESYNEV